MKALDSEINMSFLMIRKKRENLMKLYWSSVSKL